LIHNSHCLDLQMSEPKKRRTVDRIQRTLSGTRIIMRYKRFDYFSSQRPADETSPSLALSSPPSNLPKSTYRRDEINATLERIKDFKRRAKEDENFRLKNLTRLQKLLRAEARLKAEAFDTDCATSLDGSCSSIGDGEEVFRGKVPIVDARNLQKRKIGKTSRVTFADRGPFQQKDSEIVLNSEEEDNTRQRRHLWRKRRKT
jgi:hypothetical protein